MKLKRLSLLLALCMVCSLSLPCASASAGSAAVQTVQALGILTGDENGDLHLTSCVTRAQFAAMLCSASSYKDTISSQGVGYSLYRDVKSSHWASEYIRLAVEQGWMTGYTDGTFRPDQNVTLEEACTAALKLLGYSSASLAGSFPYAQLNKAASLGLRSQISRARGQAMTRQDCAQLFYNLLTAKTGSGQVYAATLGYTLTNGEVDYRAIALDNLCGPYVADSGSVTLSFTPATVYRNGVSSASAAISLNDVYYYNEGMSTLWIYSDRVSGKVSALSPSSTAPTSVTVSGRTYAIGSSIAAYDLSALNGDATREYVTLLLGMDDAVVAVLRDEDVDSVYYGVVESSVSVLSEEDSAAVQTSLTLLCTDGAARTFALDKAPSLSAGQLASVTVTSSGLSVKSLSEKHLSGTVDASASRIGDLALAENVCILDTNSAGTAVGVTAGDLAGMSLSSSDVRCYTLDETGCIDHLILNDVTGSTWTYAYLTDVDDQSQGINISVSYTWLENGTEKSLRNSSVRYPVESGGIAIAYTSDGSIRSMQPAQSLRLSQLTSTWAMSGSQKITVADGVQVYLRQDGKYYLTALSAVNAEDYTLTGWCDAASGRIRLITAVSKGN